MEKEVKELDYIKSLDLKHKAKIKWLVDGDEITKFFHGMINNNKIRNKINGLTINGVWTMDPQEIKNEAVRYFEENFKKPLPVRPTLVSSRFKTISEEDNIALIASFSEHEIRDAIWECGSEKAPGPDWFTLKFYKHSWETIKEDVIKMVRHFEKKGKLAPGCNASFISLFPKNRDLLTMKDFRPISLIGSLYKIIAKLLSGRLKRVIDKVISKEQSAFVEKRQILDDQLMLN